MAHTASFNQSQDYLLDIAQASSRHLPWSVRSKHILSPRNPDSATAETTKNGKNPRFIVWAHSNKVALTPPPPISMKKQIISSEKFSVALQYNGIGATGFSLSLFLPRTFSLALSFISLAAPFLSSPHSLVRLSSFASNNKSELFVIVKRCYSRSVNFIAISPYCMAPRIFRIHLAALFFFFFLLVSFSHCLCCIICLFVIFRIFPRSIPWQLHQRTKGESMDKSLLLRRCFRIQIGCGSFILHLVP